jgi:hypothetical protein
MVNSIISLQTKCQKYLQQLADDHQVEVNNVISELCAWAFSNAEGKKQFELWLDDAFPPKGDEEEKARGLNQELSDSEENKQEESEEECARLSAGHRWRRSGSTCRPSAEANKAPPPGSRGRRRRGGLMAFVNSWSAPSPIAAPPRIRFPSTDRYQSGEHSRTPCSRKAP